MKLGKFKKRIAAIKAKSDSLRDQEKKLSMQVIELEAQISKELGSQFRWELNGGLRYGYQLDPEQLAAHRLCDMVRSALTDLQIECIGLDGEGVRKAITKLSGAELGKKAADQVLAEEKNK
jgi:hypothetical protein